MRPRAESVAWLKNLALILISVACALALGEIALRFFVRRPPQYQSILRNALEHPERLFAPGQDATYNIKGLYKGADTVRLRVSKSRFIEPEPQGDFRFRVLFLGGSSTEAIYVPENERWVALLNEPGYLASYNAGQSGANSIDAYFTFKYLTEQRGMTFDLVVLATGFNDLGWLGKLEKSGHRFVVEDYRAGLEAYTMAEFTSSRTAYQRWEERSMIVYLFSQAWERLSRSQAAPIGPHKDGPAAVVEIYRDMRRGIMRTFRNERRAPGTTLMDRYPGLAARLDTYARDARHNLGILQTAVGARGGRLLVLSEPESWLAPTSSFLEDLRLPAGTYSYEDVDELSKWRNRVFLTAAAEVGALTYDLAAAIDSLVNGPEGGTYMYDNMHYTPDGCREVARLLRPVLRRILEAKSE